MVTPSRGLVHSRAVEAVTRNVSHAAALGHESRGWELTHDLPIPDCHEAVAAAGLATGADALWFVEEDNIPPDGALAASLAILSERDAIVAVDYPVGTEPTYSVVPRDPADGTIPWCGLGTTLVHRAVFAALERPWFRTDAQLEVVSSGSRRTVQPSAEPYEYGGQDVTFGIRATGAGFRIVAVGGMTGAHARVLAFGDRGVNDGRHRIELRDTIERAAW